MSNARQAHEEHLYDCLLTVLDQVQDGQTPNQAIIKTAQDESLPPGDIRLLVNAYNTGRTSEERQKHSHPFDKAGSFPIADIAVIIKELFPDTVKTAAATRQEAVISSDYYTDPDWVKGLFDKTAADAALVDDGPPLVPYERDPQRFAKRRLGALKKLAQESDSIAQHLEETHDVVRDALIKLGEHFRRSGNERFHDARLHCAATFGDRTKPVFDYLAHTLPKTAAESCCQHCGKGWARHEHPDLMGGKCAACGKMALTKQAIARTPADWQKEPYTTILQLLDAAEKQAGILNYARWFEPRSACAQIALEHAGEKCAVAVPQDTCALRRVLGLKKQSFLESPLSSMTQSGVEAILEKARPAGTPSLKDKVLMSVSDPEHENQLRGIKLQAALTGVLNSPYFAGENPHAVTDLFNRVARVAPRAIEQPLTAEALMRRYAAQGSLDPHDIDQLVGIETGIKKRDEPSDTLAKTTPGMIPAGAQASEKRKRD